jgi:hypothetical protein
MVAAQLMELRSLNRKIRIIFTTVVVVVYYKLFGMSDVPKLTKNIVMKATEQLSFK